MDSGIFLIIVIAMEILISAMTYNVAKSKGLNAEEWALAGFFLGILALIAVAGMADKKQRSYIRFLAEEKGWKPQEPVPKKDAGDGKRAKAGAGESEDFDITSSMYKEEGGTEVPDFKKSNLLPKTILLSNDQGEKLAYFANRGGYWYFVRFYK